MATYLILNILVMGLVALSLWRLGGLRLQGAQKRATTWASWVTLTVLLICTVVFDSLIIMANIVQYDSSKFLGLYVGAAPVEDFMYALLAAVTVPAIWRLSTHNKQVVHNAKLLWTTSRPISWVNTAFPFAASFLLSGGTLNLQFWIGTLFFLVPYNLLMYGLNDVFDYESDLRNPRKGGVQGGILAQEYHQFVIVACVAASLPFILALAILGWQHGPAPLMTLLFVSFFVVAYSSKGLRFKEVPILDSVTSSIHFVGPALYALSLFGFPAQAWPFITAFFLWGGASHAFGAIQDITPDRQARIHSIATALGARVTLYAVMACYAAATLIIVAQGWQYGAVAFGGLLYLGNAAQFVRVTDATSASTRRGWKAFLWLNYVVGALVTITMLLV